MEIRVHFASLSVLFLDIKEKLKSVKNDHGFPLLLLIMYSKA